MKSYYRIDADDKETFGRSRAMTLIILLGWLYGLSVPIMVAASLFFQGIALVTAFAAKNALKREVIV